MNTDKPILQLVDEFLADLEKAEGTRNLYRKTLQYWITWSTKNDCDIKDLTRADLINYKSFLTRSGRSAATVDSYGSAIRKFLSWLVEMGYLTRNPAEGLQWQRDRQGTFIKQALTLKEVDKLLKVHNQNTPVSKRNYAMIDLMSFTGLRCIEVTRLNIGDVKRAANRWHLQVWRKGSKERGGTINVPYDRIKPIREYWKYRSGTLSDDQPVFVNHSPRSNNTRLTPACISRIIKGSLRKIGLDSNRYTAHSLRHTAATLAYYAGSEYFEIGQMLGHSSPRQTEHYIHALGVGSTLQGRATMKINEYVQKHKKNRPKRKQS
ncbi:MAG: tyrosine-type recombinase/integrase [Bacteroidia bacterium]|nr:tyrosine-type recombinase/integrase [Bacteroidia bacterium]